MVPRPSVESRHTVIFLCTGSLCRYRLGQEPVGSQAIKSLRFHGWKMEVACSAQCTVGPLLTESDLMLSASNSYVSEHCFGDQGN